MIEKGNLTVKGCFFHRVLNSSQGVTENHEGEETFKGMCGKRSASMGNSWLFLSPL